MNPQTIKQNHRLSDYQLDHYLNMRHGVDFYFDGDVVRWKSNDNVPPRDVLAVFVDMEHCTSYEADQSNAARDVETARFLDAYRKAQANRKPSEEELYEMRAAFGPGETVVNVLTGRVTQL